MFYKFIENIFFSSLFHSYIFFANIIGEHFKRHGNCSLHVHVRVLFHFVLFYKGTLTWSGPNFTQIDFAQNCPHVHCIFVSPWIREHFCVWALKPILLSRITCLCIVSYFSVCTNYFCSSITYFMFILLFLL